MRKIEKRDRKGKDKKERIRRPRAKVLTSADIRIDYKNLELLHKLTTPSGRILSQRFTGATSRQQRELTQAVKRAKYLSLLSVGNSGKRF